MSPVLHSAVSHLTMMYPLVKTLITQSIPSLRGLDCCITVYFLSSDKERVVPVLHPAVPHLTMMYPLVKTLITQSIPLLQDLDYHKVEKVGFSEKYLMIIER